MAGVDAELRFPFINLEKAMSRAEQMFKADPQGRPMAALTVFEVWGILRKEQRGVPDCWGAEALRLDRRFRGRSRSPIVPHPGREALLSGRGPLPAPQGIESLRSGAAHAGIALERLERLTPSGHHCSELFEAGAVDE